MKVAIVVEVGAAERMAVAAEEDGVISQTSPRRATRGEVDDVLREAVADVLKKAVESWDVARFKKPEASE